MARAPGNLAGEIAAAAVGRGCVRLWWLGQAGFAFKGPAGQVVFLDPYLSEAAERLHGFRRLSLAPLTAEEVRADCVAFTHEHADHLDPDAVPVIARNNPRCLFAAPAGCAGPLAAAGVDASRRVLLEPSRSYDLPGLTIRAVAADHGTLSPTALSLRLEIDGIRIACSGDTALNPVLADELGDPRPDGLLVCINGTFGNMGPDDAARLVQRVRPRTAIPCHYWMFAEQGGDPAAFLDARRRICPDAAAELLTPGRGLTLTRTRL